MNARRDLGPIQLRYQVNGGADAQATYQSEWQGGKRYGNEGDYWYHRMRGQVSGTPARATTWRSGSRAPSKDVKSDSFTYNVRSDSGARVLVLAVEDYTGNSALPAYHGQTKPNYLDYYARRAGATTTSSTTSTTTTPWGARPGSARSAEPLRRGHLVHRQRQRHA